LGGVQPVGTIYLHPNSLLLGQIGNWIWVDFYGFLTHQIRTHFEFEGGRNGGKGSGLLGHGSFYPMHFMSRPPFPLLSEPNDLVEKC
jgi:hypothetical protein